MGFSTTPAPTASPTASPAPTAAPATATASGQAGSLPRPAVALRRIAAWGDGVPVALALSPDHAALYTATALHLRRHDAGDLARVAWDVPLDEAPAAIALSPDGATLAVARGKAVELYATDDGARVASLQHDTPVADVAFAPDGATLAAALASEVLAVWNVAAREPLRELRLPEGGAVALAGPLTSVDVAPDGRRIAAGDVNGNLAIWRLEGDLAPTMVNVGLRVVADVAFAPDGATVAAASEGWRGEPGAVWLFDAASGAGRGRLTLEDGARHLEPVVRVAFADDGASVVAGTAAGALLRWSWPDGVLRAELAAHRAAVTAIAPTPGAGLITAGRDGDLRRWNGDGAPVDELEGMPAIGAVAAGAGLVATGGEDGTLALWGEAGEPHGHRHAHHGSVNALAASPGGELLASAGDDGAVRLWSMPDCEPRGELLGHEGPVLALAFSADGSLLASAGWDGTIRVWSVPEGQAVERIAAMVSDGLSATAVFGVAFDGGGRSLAATAFDGAVRRFKLEGGAPMPPLETGAGGWLIAVASPAPGLTAALDDSGILWAWGADGRLAGREALADATAVAHLADGRLLSVGPAGGLHLWHLDGAGLTELAAAASVGDRVAVAPGATLAAVGSRRGFVEVWGLPSAKDAGWRP